MPVAPLEYVTDAIVLSLDQERGPTQDRLHERGERLLPLPHDQVQMIRHDRVREQLDVGEGELVADDPEQCRAELGLEQRLASVQARREVERAARQVWTYASAHG
jgi:hypothetical protein